MRNKIRYLGNAPIRRTDRHRPPCPCPSRSLGSEIAQRDQWLIKVGRAGQADTGPGPVKLLRRRELSYADNDPRAWFGALAARRGARRYSVTGRLLRIKAPSIPARSRWPAPVQFDLGDIREILFDHFEETLRLFGMTNAKPAPAMRSASTLSIHLFGLQGLVRPQWASQANQTDLRAESPGRLPANQDQTTARRRGPSAGLCRHRLERSGIPQLRSA